MQVVIQCRLKPDAVEIDRRLMAEVFDELERERPDWLRWDAYRLDDGVTVVSVVEVDDPSRLAELPTFAAYRRTLDERCEEPPVTRVAEQLGAYRP